MKKHFRSEWRPAAMPEYPAAGRFDTVWRLPAMFVRVLCLSVGLLVVPGAQAEPEEDEQAAAWQARLDRAAERQAEGKARQEAADAILTQRNRECASRFLVNACREDARQEHLRASHEARRLENEGKAIEREVKKEQLAERERRRAAEAPHREAERQSREAETAAARQAGEQRQATIRADKATRAAEGEQRKAADAERLSKKQAAHAEKVANKRREAERQAAEQAAKK